MSVIRFQHLTHTVATLPNAVETTIDIVRPTTPGQGAYAEGSDWVTSPRVVDDEEGGKVIVVLPAAIGVATVFVRALQVWDSGYPAQSGLSGPLFPSGAAVATTPSLVRSIFTATGNTLAANSGTLVSMLGGVFATVQQPGITLMARQFVRLVLFNNSGAPIGPATIEAKYDMGINQAALPTM